jgi:glycine/D-amino acid oxidase-like deaminating enzyme
VELLEQLVDWLTALPPWAAWVGIVLATFVSEDLTCIAAGLLAASGEIGAWTAIPAAALGIFLGDVTRPLTAAEKDACNFRSTLVITDTRTLRHYYRLLPDDRVQIGSRSAITGADAANPRHLKVLIGGLNRKFPALTGIDIDYSWWGWVDVSHDMMPRIVQPDPKQTLFYALGYGGNGVMYSAQAGRRMAEQIAG